MAQLITTDNQNRSQRIFGLNYKVVSRVFFNSYHNYTEVADYAIRRHI